MQLFKINRDITIVCESAKTRNGFKHTATLVYKDSDRESVKINYLNRTWERYQYESVLEKLVEKSEFLNATQKRSIHFISNYR